MKKLLYILVFIICMSGMANAEDYYFKVGEGAGTCLAADPCSTLAQAQTIINNATEESTLYFNKGDTWSVDSAASPSTSASYGLTVDSNDQIIHVDAYGAGADPKFDGLVSDFSAVPYSDCTYESGDGPCKTSRFFDFQRADCSVKNVEIKRVYGHAIQVKNGDGFVLSDSYIHDFGSSAIAGNISTDIINITVENNIIHTGQELYKNGKRSGWEAAIQLTESGNGYQPNSNIVRFNVVYDIYGECINAPNSTIERNIIGNCGSMAIGISPQDFDTTTTIVKYNLVIMADRSTHTYDSHSGGSRDGVRVFDEKAGGSNASGLIEILGNIIINEDYCMEIGKNAAVGDQEAFNVPFGEVRIYNNTCIDSFFKNINIYDLIEPREMSGIATAFNFYNNALIYYDKTGVAHIGDNSMASYSGATISNNAYWDDQAGDGGTIDSDWNTNDQEGDPLLYGEEKGSPINWDGLASGDPRSNGLTFNDIIPNNGSSLFLTGIDPEGYETYFLSTDTDFTVLPDTQTFNFIDLDSLGAHGIGAGFPGFVISSYGPTGLQSCGYGGNINITTSEASDCKYSVHTDDGGSDTCATSYDDLDTAFDDNGGNLTSHTTDVGAPACNTDIRYVIKCQADDDDAVSNCADYTMYIDSDSNPPNPAPVTQQAGGNVTQQNGGNVVVD